jgi:hypothetical protein
MEYEWILFSLFPLVITFRLFRAEYQSLKSIKKTRHLHLTSFNLKYKVVIDIESFPSKLNKQEINDFLQSLCTNLRLEK